MPAHLHTYEHYIQKIKSNQNREPGRYVEGMALKTRLPFHLPASESNQLNFIFTDNLIKIPFFHWIYSVLKLITELGIQHQERKKSRAFLEASSEEKDSIVL